MRQRSSLEWLQALCRRRHGINSTTPFFVGPTAHDKYECCAINHIRVRYPWAVERLAIKRGTLNVLVLLRAILSYDMEYLAIPYPNLDVAEKGTANVVDGETRSDRIEAKAGEDYERSKSTSILIPGYAHQVVTEPSLETLAYTLLCLPRSSSIIIYIRYME